MTRFYLALGLPISASSREVIRAAVWALHPGLRRNRVLRASRRRFYREMLNEHDAAQDLARCRGV